MARASFTARALLSDLDGTLVDTEPLYFECYRRAVSSLTRGAVDYTEAFHVRHLHGKPEGIGAETIVREFALTVSASDVLAVRDAHLLEAFETVPLCAGAARAVELLQTVLPPGRFAVATSSKEKLVAIKRKSAPVDSLLSQFDAVVCSDSPVMKGRPGKPAPDAFLSAAAVLGVDAADCIVFEDSLAGIAGGAAAGCFVVGLTAGRIEREAAVAAGAHVVLESLEEFHLGLVGF
jgi:beta-phosphoglucomutase-like phosphatase (HAD superfamily)